MGSIADFGPWWFQSRGLCCQCLVSRVRGVLPKSSCVSDVQSSLRDSTIWRSRFPPVNWRAILECPYGDKPLRLHRPVRDGATIARRFNAGTAVGTQAESRRDD